MCGEVGPNQQHVVVGACGGRHLRRGPVELGGPVDLLAAAAVPENPPQPVRARMSAQAAAAVRTAHERHAASGARGRAAAMTSSIGLLRVFADVVALAAVASPRVSSSRDR